MGKRSAGMKTCPFPFVHPFPRSSPLPSPFFASFLFLPFVSLSCPGVSSPNSGRGSEGLEERYEGPDNKQLLVNSELKIML